MKLRRAAGAMRKLAVLSVALLCAAATASEETPALPATAPSALRGPVIAAASAEVAPLPVQLAANVNEDDEKKKAEAAAEEKRKAEEEKEKEKLAQEEQEKEKRAEEEKEKEKLAEEEKAKEKAKEEEARTSTGAPAAKAQAEADQGSPLVSLYFFVLVASIIVHVAVYHKTNHLGLKDETWERNYADCLLGFVLFAGVVLYFASQEGPVAWWGTVAFLIIYVGSYAYLHFTYAVGTPRRTLVENSMCCWKSLYLGQAFPLYNVIFSPFLLVFHACRIYFGTCLSIYALRLYWRFFAQFHDYYTDPDFPPNDESLGGVTGDSANKASGKTNAEVIWVRAGDFARKSIKDRSPKPKLYDSEMNLFQGKIEPNDVRQGALGDCWLLASMSALAEHEGAIRYVFCTKELDPLGRYVVRLFDPADGHWKYVTVDDHVPCKRDPYAEDGVARGKDGMPIALYARPHENEVWAMILEKAVAKLCGSYHAIEGGFTEWGVHCLTGKKAWRYTFHNTGSGYEFTAMNLKCEAGVNIKSWPEPNAKYNEDDFFKLLTWYNRNGAVLCCGGVPQEGEELGLMTSHAYSILRVVQVTESYTSTNYFRFVQIRNPWGDGEWTGPWSDSSPLWEKYPYVKKTLGHEKTDDGSFYMQWEDFCKYWGYAGCVDCNLDIRNVHMPPYDTHEREGPAKAFFQGCFEYWCMCQGPLRYFLPHESSDRKVSSKEFNDWGGCDPSGCYFRLFDDKAVSATTATGASSSS
eukprot:TRINITY_DN16367_c0_g1_i1.p1 TRINITY_DN16367_c0_g1~~TRINITY_DN16367_c0_g1_i1.p1  ORF type:complete len:749 (+),score=208.04 TRINITY_DN16367_c0_g1_i1:95-2341(+)